MNRPQLFARLLLAAIGLLVLTLALTFAGCASHRPEPVATIASDTVRTVPGHLSEPLPNASIVAPQAGLNTATWPVKFRAQIDKQADKLGLLAGIGTLFSTPEGRADRQAVRLARAAVPRSIGKGAVYAINSKVVAAYKAKAPTVQADSGATVSNAAANAQQQNVKGNGNKLGAKQANPTQEAKGWAATLTDNLTGWIPWALGGALVLAVVFRKRLPIVGPFFS